MLNLKSKIYAGLSVLILVIIVIASAGIYSVEILSRDSSEIIKDNYKSVDYSFKMLTELDSVKSNLIMLSNISSKESTLRYDLNKSIINHLQKFAKVLENQSNNITEPGESELVQLLLKDYSEAAKLIMNSTNTESGKLTSSVINSMDILQKTVYKIYVLNMTSILEKNNVAKETSTKTITYMFVISAFSLIIILFYIIRFPNYIVNPISELTEKIRAVSSKQYDQKIDVKSKDEIGALTESFNEMSEKLKEYSEQHLDQLLLEKNRVFSIVHGLKDGVLLLDENLNVLLINTTASKIISVEGSEILNNNITSLKAKNKTTELICSIISTPKDKRSPEHIDVYDDLSSQYFNVEIIEISNYDEIIEGKKTKGIVIILKNVTPFKEKDIAKTNMLATVSHELKTPISSINFSLKLLSDSRIGNLSDEQKKIVESITQQNKKLLKVVNEVLDFAQTESGKINLVIEPVDASEVIDLASSALLMLLSEKEINLKLDIMDNPPLIKADLEKSVWILVNILNNAIRYSSVKGDILLSLRQENNFIMFSVRDFGPGISDADKERIFKKFIKDKTGYFKGTGLGLAIAKEFAESQGGRIWLESYENNGCHFHFTLPILQQ